MTTTTTTIVVLAAALLVALDGVAALERPPLVHLRTHFSSVDYATDDAATPTTLRRLTHAAAQQRWFEHPIDNFNELDQRTFRSRFYVNLEHYRAPTTNATRPVLLLYINGEAAAGAAPHAATDEVVEWASEWGAAIATMEHRYYGLSLPFAQLSVDNLQFHTVQQSLADLARFTQFLKDPRDGILGVHGPNAVVVAVGGSYSGALSAWFRTKYPHLADAALASSGVVHAINEFVHFDEQVSASLDAWPETAGCADQLRIVTGAADEALRSSDPALAAAFKAKFTAQALDDAGDFFYFLADTMAESVQYGYQTHMCSAIANISDSDALVDVYSSYVRTTWIPMFGRPAVYATAHQQLENVTETMNYRSWWWQKCAQLAYFQVAPTHNSIRSSWVNETYHRRHCAALFDSRLPFPPRTNWTNDYFGWPPLATNIYYANGSQDPWQWATVQSSLGATTLVEYVQCLNCGHCVDLSGCPDFACQPYGNDGLSIARKVMRTNIARWIGIDDRSSAGASHVLVR